MSFNRRRGDSQAHFQPMYRCLLCADDRFHPGGRNTVDDHMWEWHELREFTASDGDSTDGVHVQTRLVDARGQYMAPGRS